MLHPSIQKKKIMVAPLGTAGRNQTYHLDGARLCRQSNYEKSAARYCWLPKSVNFDFLLAALGK